MLFYQFQVSGYGLEGDLGRVGVFRGKTGYWGLGLRGGVVMGVRNGG